MEIVGKLFSSPRVSQQISLPSEFEVQEMYTDS